MEEIAAEIHSSDDHRLESSDRKTCTHVYQRLVGLCLCFPVTNFPNSVIGVAAYSETVDVALKIIRFRPIKPADRPNALYLSDAGLGVKATVEEILDNETFRNLLPRHFAIEFHRCRQTESIIPGRTVGYRLQYPATTPDIADEHARELLWRALHGSVMQKRCVLG